MKKKCSQKRDNRYKGKVGVREFQGMLSLRFSRPLSRSLFSTEQKIISLGLKDNPENREKAARIAARITLDIEDDDFDLTLNRYGLTLKYKSNDKEKKLDTLVGLYKNYMLSRQDLVKPSTWKESYQRTLKRLQKSPFADMMTDLESEQAYQVYDWVIASYAPEPARQLMIQLNACFNWAIERKLVLLEKSPFDGLARQISKTFKKSKQIQAFTAVERDMIIQAFQDSARYRHYANYVRFLFFTGCRPSEAIGLEWDDIAPDFSWIRFHQAVVRGVRCEGLKTQESRIFPCNDQLKSVLIDARQANPNNPKIVFPNKRGNLLSDSDFREYAWQRIIQKLPLIPLPPYCMRHTFITLCLEHGLDAKDIAQLVGNSAEIIYKHYAAALQNIEVPILISKT